MGNWILLSPGGLATGLATLAIPLAIHLISRSRGQRVLVGSIRLIREARRKLVYELRMTQWLLYTVRSSVLLVAALILGRLTTPGLESITSDAAYATPGWLTAAAPAERQKLTQDFESVRILAPGFPLEDEFTADTNGDQYDLWPLLAERLSLVSHQATVHVFTSGKVNEFGQSAPPLPQPISWHAARADEAKTVDLPLRVAIIRGAGVDERARAVEQALQVIRKHRLPKLQWTVYLPGQPLSPSEHDAVIMTVSNHTVRPGTRGPSDLQWLDLGHGDWQETWNSADFPQQLLDALLDEQDSARIWSATRVTQTGLSNAPVPPERASQLPRKPAQKWLALVLILLWGIERWLCERKANASV